jgi:Protein of unknown function (DUF2786)
MTRGTDGGRDRALDKIRKLLAVARDGRGNENEAAIAAGQAESLMRKWQVESAEELLEEVQRDDAFDRGLEDVSFEGIKGHAPKRAPTWVGFIAIGCGAAFTCKVDLVRTPAGVMVRFSGFAPDVVLCRWVYRFLCERVFELSRERCAGCGMAVAASFRLGAAGALQDRLYLIRESRFADLEAAASRGGAGPASAGPSTAIALYDAKARRVEEMFGGQEKVQREVDPGSAIGYMMGHEAGSRMHIPTNAPIADGGSKIVMGRIP